MAFVALSRVCTLKWITFIIIDPLSRNPCINEINRLRSKFRSDLPLLKKTKGKKRKIQVTGVIDSGEPSSKNVKCLSVMYKVPVTVLYLRKSTDLHMSNCSKKSKICDDNALNKPCPKKGKLM